MKFLKIIALYFISLMVLASCAGKDTENQDIKFRESLSTNTSYQSSYPSIKNIERIQLLRKENRVFQNLTRQEDALLTNALQRMKSLLVVLNTDQLLNANRLKSFKELYYEYLQISNLHFNDFSPEFSLLEALKVNLSRYLNYHINQNKLNLDLLKRVVHSEPMFQDSSENKFNYYKSEGRINFRSLRNVPHMLIDSFNEDVFVLTQVKLKEKIQNTDKIWINFYKELNVEFKRGQTSPSPFDRESGVYIIVQKNYSFKYVPQISDFDLIPIQLPFQLGFKKRYQVEIDLSKYQDAHSLTFGFLYYGERNPRIHKVSGTIESFFITTNMTQEIEFKKPKSDLLEEGQLERISFFDTFKETKLIQDESSASFEQSTRSSINYVSISGFKGRKSGISYMILPKLSLLLQDICIRVNQQVNHYKNRENQRLKFYLHKYPELVSDHQLIKEFNLDEWIEMEIPLPQANSWEWITSEKIDVSSTSKDFIFAFSYESQEPNEFPSWSLNTLDIFEDCQR